MVLLAAALLLLALALNFALMFFQGKGEIAP